MKAKMESKMIEKHELMKVCGYEFVKIGTFYNAEKFGTKKYPNYNLAIKLVDKEVLNAEKSAYLITKEIKNEPKIIYVGYYSHSLEHRWIYVKNGIFYAWHQKADEYIEKSESVQKFSLWITTNPYATDSNGDLVNISFAIEQKIIQELNPKGNTVNKNIVKTKSVKNILDLR
jgi:hypothetical protein